MIIQVSEVTLICGRLIIKHLKTPNTIVIDIKKGAQNSFPCVGPVAENPSYETMHFKSYLVTSAFIITTNSHNLQVLGVGLAVSLCITVIFIWGLLNINKIQVILCSLQNLHSNTLHHLQVYARNSRVTWLDFLLKKHK